MSDLNYCQLFELIIDELLEKAEEDISRFSCNENDNYSDADAFFNNQKAGKIRNIEWKDPRCNDETLMIDVNLTDGTMYIEMPGEEEGIEEDIGHGTNNATLKKKFFRLYRLVEEYVNVQLAEETMSSFYDAVQRTFPSMMDRLILEKHDDEEQKE